MLQLAQLKHGLEHSPQVQNLLGLADEINQTTPPQLRGAQCNSVRGCGVESDAGISPDAGVIQRSKLFNEFFPEAGINRGWWPCVVVDPSSLTGKAEPHVTIYVNAQITSAQHKQIERIAKKQGRQARVSELPTPETLAFDNFHVTTPADRLHHFYSSDSSTVLWQVPTPGGGNAAFTSAPKGSPSWLDANQFAVLFYKDFLNIAASLASLDLQAGVQRANVSETYSQEKEVLGYWRK
jgi:hypothetical protein